MMHKIFDYVISYTYNFKGSNYIHPQHERDIAKKIEAGNRTGKLEFSNGRKIVLTWELLQIKACEFEVIRESLYSKIDDVFYALPENKLLKFKSKEMFPEQKIALEELKQKMLNLTVDWYQQNI